ncbi:uncharacterized protein LOC114517807 [Dendronephthya gigantea]|uniref:uncharacterized protein LOC114517807 n=1 Tax=Dendronephthya gigantea TaxID=151771 RepID=UPI00106A66F9|nr:uncharacterized protein LOC114517807 [Dendronephthya gigantea]XP_028393431.1 uncharacterized protein LOC114517807 [Dendronephthya gigantea]XP_028393432.1 uncharacterized protein LOC114517807 [Dendronephthya gigantea]
MADGGEVSLSANQKETKENVNVNDEEDMRAFRGKHYFRLVASTAGFVVLAWIFGRFGCGMVWLIPFLVFVFSWWNRTSSEILETTSRLAALQAHRERAFKNAETAEWLNFILNRWCVFSDSSILSLIKTSLDPTLEYYKPTFIESIEVEDFTLGNRTPFFKYIECFDSFDDNRKIKASELAMRFPPSDLARTPKYKAVMDVDIGLSSPDSKFVIRIKLAKAGMLDLSTDIAVEDFHIHGKMQFVFSFNRNIPFPHLAAISLCFLEEPEVEFNIRMLKAVQLMEFPLLKNWVANLVNDCLKLSLVDPGRLTIPLCDDPEVLGHGAQYACGILTLTIEGGYDGRLTDDVHWCALTLGEQKRQMKEINHGDEWSDKISILVYSLVYDKIIIKMKAKRKLGNKYTVLEYQLPLARLGLDLVGNHEQVFEKSRQRGSKLKAIFEYSPLPVLNITNDTTEEEFQKNYLDKMSGEETNGQVAGVMCVCIHSAQNLLPMDKNGLSDPYCIVYENKTEIKATSCVENTLDPVWDNVVEFCTADYTKTVVSLVLHDKDVTALETLRIKDDPDDFMGSCNFYLTKEEPYFFKRRMDVLFRVNAGTSGLKKAGTICVSSMFRPVAAVAQTEKLRPMGGLPDGEPLDKKFLKKKTDPQALEAIQIAEKGGIEIQIIQGRNLVVMDVTGKSDPFVTIKFGSGKGKERFKSQIKYNTLTPVWNETCRLPLPNQDDKMTIDVWDKDPLSQEKMGHVTFTRAELKAFEKNPGVKEWYKLKKVKTGEIQLAFTYVPPQSQQGDAVSVDTSIERSSTVDSAVIEKPVNMNDNNNGELGNHSNNQIFHDVSGEVGDVKDLPDNKDQPQVYFKARFDSHRGGKKSRASFSQNNVLFKTSFFPYANRHHLGVPFQHKGTINSNQYLILEVKGKGKTHETVDYVAVSLGELFAGNKYSSRWLHMDNGASIHVTMTCKEITTLPGSPGRTGRSRLSFRRKNAET